MDLMRKRKVETSSIVERNFYPLVTAAQMQALDRRTIQEAKVPGTTLMERAGKGVVQVLEQELGPSSGKNIVVFCGKGNNGGDGLVIARLLSRNRAKIHVVLLANPKELTQDSRYMYRRLIKSAKSVTIHPEPSEKTIHAVTTKADIIIDALLGAGLSTPVRESYCRAIQIMNTSEAPTIAVDLPSGIHSDSGAAMGTAVNAQTTVTFGVPKIGLYLGDAIDHAGTITTVDIGIPQSYVDELQSPFHLLTPDYSAMLLPKRTRNSHKGTYGHAGIIAGSPGKTGAAVLAARATLRSGAGLVTIATPQSAQASLDAKLLEAMTYALPETNTNTLGHSALSPIIEFAKDRDAIAIGPGLGVKTGTGKLIRQLLPQLRQHCVIDADGLNALAGHDHILRSCHKMPVVTPHPGEMARLMKKASAKTINRNRLTFSLQFAKQCKTIVVLKGARTIIAEPDGHAAICTTGNSGMASAGMGDALTGIIVSLLAQGLTPWNSACAGVCLHGIAGDIAANTLGQAGMIASDLIEHLPYAIQETISLQ